jgi:hypothetical protein
MNKTALLMCITLAVASSCQDTVDSTMSFGSNGSIDDGDDGATDGADGDDGDGADGDDGDDGGDDGDGALFDVGDGEGLPGDGDGTEGCEKVDFLFVIDNSGSMLDEQDNLIQSFPGFMEAIESTVDVDDFHVLTTTTDATTTTNCEEYVCAGGLPVWPPPCPGYACNTQLDACDGTLGAANVRDAGMQPCQLDNPERYLTEATSDRDAAFACIGRPGAGGADVEQPVGALLAAVSDDLNGAGACNEGFLRNDAILVVTIITDETPTEIHGDPQDWHARLVAAKGGNADAIVMLNISGPRDSAEAAATACWDPLEAPQLHEFADMFGERGRNGSVCADDFSPFLLDAVSIIDQTCDEFDPEG